MEAKEELHICLVQCDLLWEDKAANLQHIEQLLRQQKNNDLIVLPEMFSTGFSANAQVLAEPVDGATMQQIRQWAAQYHSALAGSIIIQEGNAYYNRGFFVKPDGETWFYDKKHLFFGGEKAQFQPGNQQVRVEYLGWRIALFLCYDLRFPVWMRNTTPYYDLLLCIAQWPSNRGRMFEALLQARAIENQAYVCGINRVGTDGNFLKYSGATQLIDYQGKVLARCTDNQEELLCQQLALYPLQSHREKQPVWQDADAFMLLNDKHLPL